MPPPSNISGITAIDVGTLPASINQDVHDAGTTYTVWYKYTAVIGDTMIGVWGFGGTPDTGYQPNLTIYGPNSFTIFIMGGGRNDPMQVMVTPGSVYYFKFERNNATITPANLAISIVKFEESTYSAGSILVPDDNPGFPAAILSSITDAHPLKYLPAIPTGEEGAILDNGIMILNDNDDAIVKLFNPDFSLITSLTTLPYTASLTSDSIDAFYSAHNGTNPPTVWKITSTGVITQAATLPLITTGGGVRGMSVSPDESILYYKVYPGGDFNKIKRHDLLTDTPLSNLVDTPTAGYQQDGRETLCLKDGTIIVSYRSAAGLPSDYRIIRYNPDGSTASTYVNTGGFTYPGLIRLATAIDNPNSFWAWMEPSPTVSGNGTSTFLNIKVSDGSILNSISGQQYEVGEFRGPQTATPIRFGHSQSCPFLILRSTEPIPPELSGIYFVNPTKSSNHDTYYDRSVTPAGNVERKIPDPTIRTALLGE